MLEVFNTRTISIRSDHYKMQRVEVLEFPLVSHFPRARAGGGSRRRWGAAPSAGGHSDALAAAGRAAGRLRASLPTTVAALAVDHSGLGASTVKGA